MMRDLWVAGTVALLVGFSCNGGRLDAFTNQRGSATGGSAATGGNGGTNTTGGSGGTGIQPSGGEGGVDDIPGMLLVDDFEDGDRVALIQDGEWWVANNNSGVQNLTVERPSLERPGSVFSLHTSGVGFEDSGATLLLDIAGNAATIDVSEYAALSFVARAEAGSTQEVLFAFYVGNQHFAVPLRFQTDWEPHTIPFTAAIPVEPGPDTSFNPRALAAIRFMIPPDVSFDFWLDDLAFVK
jgi:hypothetical protein